jgi:ubiquinone/menaquinone biosynthesis C-methylase UbiE
MPDSKTLSRAAFSKDAPTYDQSQRYSSLRAAYPTIAKEAFRQPFQAVLDIGCGTGGLLSVIHEQREAAKLFGLDLSEEMIALARAKLRNADLRVGDSEHLPYENGAFDLVTCTFSFHHYPNPKAVLTEVQRVLREGGRLIMADPSIFPPLRQVFNALTRFSSDGGVHYYSTREMTDLAKSAGLRPLKWAKLNWHSFLFVAER